MMGSPLAGDSTLLVDIIKARASICASSDSGTCTAIWSPSKSALYAVHTSGCSWIALPSISTGSKAWMPRRCRVGARLSSTGCSRITSSRMSHTSGPWRSTSFFAALIEVVQIGSREAAAVERHQRAQLGRQYRQHGHHHPLGTVARFDEGLHQLEALGEFLDAGLRAGGHDLVTQARHFFLQVDAGQQLVHRLGTHARVELVAIFFDGVEILLVGEQLAALELGHARIDHDEGFEIEHTLDVAQRHVEQQTH